MYLDPRQPHCGTADRYYHIALSPPIVERWKLQEMQPLYIRSQTDTSHQLCGCALYPLNKPLVCPVERPPYQITIL